MFFAWLLFAALIAALAVYLITRVSTAVRQWREPTTHWSQRSPVDRRRRNVPVAVERRAGPRREEDVARQFLAVAGTRRVRRSMAQQS